jgi:protease IV
LFFIILLSYINLSIATSERSRALYANPAGLSVHSYPEISIRSEDYWVSMNIPFLGFAGGVRFKSDSMEFMTGVSPLHYKDKFSLGYMYSSWNDKYTLGAMYRPHKWLSLGFTTVFPSSEGYDFNFGVSVIPGWDRLVLTSDFNVDRGQNGTRYLTQSVTGTLEIVEGVKMHVGFMPFDNDFGDGDIYGGLEFSLGNLFFGAYHGDSDDEGIVTASVVPYPSLIKGESRAVVVEIKGDYPEVPNIRGFLGKEHAFYNLLNLLNYVKDSKKIDSVIVYIKANSLGLAQSEEVRGQLKNIAKDKFLIVHADYYGFKDLYLASAADLISVSPPGAVYFAGLYLSKMYLKGALDKLEVEPEVASVGKYKSAIETFTKEEMSDYDRKQIREFLDDLISVVVGEMADSREIDEDRIKSLIDSLGFFTPEEAIREGLIDTLAYFDEVKDIVGIEGEGKVWRGKTVPREFLLSDPPKIAVLTLEGSIIVGESSNSPMDIPFFGGAAIGSESVTRELKRLRKDNSVKAVVVRINSGGGSSLASDLIYRELINLKEEKPVVISMGNIVASGGYYISAPADLIIANKTTLTGSIGVWGAKFVTEGLYNKLGITHDIVKWGKHSDALSSHRPFSYYEKEMFNKMLKHIYDQFLQAVATPRDLTVEKVDSLAMGRIWSGLAAKEISLVDEYGGLLDAINMAADEAEIKNYKVVLYPKPLKFLERLMGVKETAYLPILKLIQEPYLYFEPARLEFGR